MDDFMYPILAPDSAAVGPLLHPSRRHPIS